MFIFIKYYQIMLLLIYSILQMYAHACASVRRCPTCARSGRSNPPVVYDKQMHKSVLLDAAGILDAYGGHSFLATLDFTTSNS